MRQERASVSAIEAAIDSCKYLVPDFPRGDKGPLTDGKIDLHSGFPPKNANFLGRVPVQIKGRSRDPKARIPNSFNMTKKDARAYLANSGVLYFVVFLNKNDNLKPLAITYSLLSPYKLKALLDKSDRSKKSISFDLSPIPEDPTELHSLVTMAFRTRKQDPANSIDIADLQKPESFHVFTNKKINFEHPVILSHSELDFVVEVQTLSGARLPLEGEFRIIPDSYSFKPTDLVISSGDYLFSDALVRRVSPEIIEFKPSDGLSFEFPDSRENVTTNFSFEPRSSLKGWHEDTGFYLSVIDTRLIKIGDYKAKVQAVPLPDTEKMRHTHRQAGLLIDLFLFFKVDASLIQMSEITQKRFQQLVTLHDIFVEGKFPPQTENTTGRIRQPVGKWALDILVVVQDGDPVVQFKNLFDRNSPGRFFEIDENNSSYVPLTPYDVVSDELFPFTLNLDLEHIVDSYQSLDATPNVLDNANRTVLKLLNSIKAAPEREKEFLHAAFALNSWLLELKPSKTVHSINQWQIESRLSPLTSEQKAEIKKVKRKAIKGEVELSALVEISCAILLGDQEEVHDLFAGLSSREQELLVSWPIYDLSPVELTPQSPASQA